MGKKEGRSGCRRSASAGRGHQEAPTEEVGVLQYTPVEYEEKLIDYRDKKVFEQKTNGLPGQKGFQKEI